MNETMLTPERVRELLLKRQNSLLLLSQYRKEIERAARRDGDDEQPATLKRNVLGAVCNYLLADFAVFLDGNVKENPKPPAGDVEITDDKRQQFAIEIWCNPDPAKREILKKELQDILSGAIELHRKELYRAMGISDKEGMHVNKLHRVAGVIEYPLKYVAKFEPQVWQNDYAIPVDPKGDTTWDCTEFICSPDNSGYFNPDTRRAIREENGGWLDKEDVLYSDPNAPQWIREWDGPFTITVTET